MRCQLTDEHNEQQNLSAPGENKTTENGKYLATSIEVGVLHNIRYVKDKESNYLTVPIYIIKHDTALKSMAVAILYGHMFVSHIVAEDIIAHDLSQITMIDEDVASKRKIVSHYHSKDAYKEMILKIIG